MSSNPHKFPQFRIEGKRLLKYVKPTDPQLSRDHDHWKLVVPKEDRKNIISESHDVERSGHLGIFKTFWRMKKRYFWPKMHVDVARYVRSCRLCAAGLMGNRPISRYPWQVVSLDFVGPLPRSSQGYRFLLLITDYFSKYVLVFQTRNATSTILCKHVLNELFLIYGAPQHLICDNGSAMRGRDFDELCRKYSVNILFTPNYCPRADPTKCVNRVLKTMISTFVKGNHRQ